MSHSQTQEILEGCFNKVLQAGSLEQQSYSHGSRGQKPLKRKVLSIFVPLEGRKGDSVHDSPELPMLIGNL